MKKILPPLALFFLMGINMNAQIVGRFYYNKKWQLTKQDSAVYFRVSVFDTSKYLFGGEVRDFTKDGKPMMKGTYKFGKRNGNFTFYRENGQVESTGNFINDERSGTWKYYHRNGQAKCEIEFVPGQVYKTLYYADSTGKRLLENGTGFWMEEYMDAPYDEPVINEGHFKNSFRDGEWICHLQSGKILYTEKYDDGKLVTGKLFITDPKGIKYSQPVNNHMLVPFQIEITENLIFAKGVDESDYPFLKRRMEEVFSPVEASAYPTGGIQAFYKEIARVQQYPKQALRMGIEGRVYVEFVINKDGTLTDFRVTKGIGAGCDEEAIRSIQESTIKVPWVPGMQRGRPVKQRYSLPIIFKLGS